MKFNYFLFDLDNTLLRIPDYSNFFDNILLETIKRLTDAPLPTRIERNQFWYSGETYKEVLQQWGIKKINLFWKYFDEIDFENRKSLAREKRLHLFEDVHDILEFLKNQDKKIAIISNAADYIVDFVVETFELEPYFDHAFGLGFDKDQEIAKPSPKGIQKVLSHLNFNGNLSEVLMVGDSFVDIFAAKNANITACLITREFNKYPDGFGDWEHQPDYIINKLYDILSI